MSQFPAAPISVTMATERSTAAKDHSCTVPTIFYKVLKSLIIGRIGLLRRREQFLVIAFEFFDLGMERQGLEVCKTLLIIVFDGAHSQINLE